MPDLPSSGAPGDSVAPPQPATAMPKGRLRWVIAGLLFLAVVLSYIDRLVISVLKPTLSRAYDWKETGYADMVFWFQAVYGLGFLFFGRLIDAIGPRLGYVLAMSLWTVSHMAHIFMRSTLGFTLVRIPLALGESGTFPAALTAISQWFPRRERALAIGIANAGANVGAIVTPALVPVLTLMMGWQAAFLITGAFNLVWILAWWLIYRKPSKHPLISAPERTYIEAEPQIDEGRAGFLAVLKHRACWAYMAGRFLIDPIWWTFLFWLPDFFSKRFHVDLKGFGPPLIAIYVLADLGAILGGWYSSRLIGSGQDSGKARRQAMLLCALVVLPVMVSAEAPGVWAAVLLIGLACAGHQGFSTNHFSLPGDLFPRYAQGTVVGLGGFAGALGGMLMSKYAGQILENLHSYAPIFVVSGLAYLAALIVTRLILPRYEAVHMKP